MNKNENLISKLNKLLVTNEFRSYMLSHTPVYRGNLGIVPLENGLFAVGYIDSESTDTWEPEPQFADFPTTMLVWTYINDVDPDLFKMAYNYICEK